MKKNEKRVKGTGVFYEDNSFDFIPNQNTGEKRNEVIKKRGKSVLYKTLGEQQSSIVAHLVSSSEDTDPIASLIEDFNSLIVSQDEKRKMKIKKRKLCETDNLKINYLVDANEIEITVLESNKSLELVKRDMVNFFSKIISCLLINRTYLAKHNL